MALANSHQNVTAMAAEAGVANVLEGSTRRSGDRVRVTVQLIAVPNERHIWSQTYDRQLADIFRMQDELAQSIAEQLRIRLDPKVLDGFAKAPTRSIEAYDLVLRATAMRPKNRRDLETMTNFLERAIALDPNYADAYGWLASVGFPIQAYGLDWHEVRPRVHTNIERAHSLNPDNVPALAAMAYYATQEENSRAAGLKYLARALAVAPGNPLIHVMYGTRSNDYRERLRHWQEAYRLDPLDPNNSSTYIAGLLEQGELDAALAAAKRAVAYGPESAGAFAGLGDVYLARGDEVAGLRELKRAVELNPADLSLVSEYVLALLMADFGAPAWHWVDAVGSVTGESASARALRG
jgi:tetratricopeptide (TPR) repeat protein